MRKVETKAILMISVITITQIFFLFIVNCEAQQFERLPIEEMFKTEKKINFREIFVSSKGDLIITSSMNFAEFFGGQFTMNFNMGGLTDAKGNPDKAPQNNIFADVYYLHTGFKGVTGNSEDMIYMISDNNHFGWIDHKKGYGFGIPPFNFPIDQGVNIKRIWLDKDGDLFVTTTDTIYLIESATDVFKDGGTTLKYKSIEDKNGNTIITEGAKTIRKFTLERNVVPYCFAEAASGSIYVGTNKGIFQFDKRHGRSYNLFGNGKDDSISVTCIQTKNFTDIWFSTLEKGMGVYSVYTKAVEYYPYKNQQAALNSIQNFTNLSSHEFLVAIKDSLPAIFNTETYQYEFINDTAFTHSGSGVTDIKVGTANVIFLIKGGDLYVSQDFLKKRGIISNYAAEPYLKELLINGKPYRERLNFQTRNDSIKKIVLKYYENHIDIGYAARGITSSDTVMFGWKVDGLWDEWQVVPFGVSEDRLNMVNFDLKPGNYIFRTKMKIGKADWLKKELLLTIVVEPPFWRTWWFWTAAIVGLVFLIYLIVRVRVNAARKQERLKAQHEKQLLELEAKALRAQMNPHFIFNCLNSIKSLIQQHEQEKSITYLTTFSKLIRTLFNNADKKEISLYDEIETCKLYLQLEAMRFNSRFSYTVNVDEDIDLKSIQVPALIVQPFIENAIWHGIMPKDSDGNISLNVLKDNGEVKIIIDGNGIGREVSAQNRSVSGMSHQSKGVNLTQSRLELNNVLQQRKARLEILDKKDPKGMVSGTTVIITMSQDS